MGDMPEACALPSSTLTTTRSDRTIPGVLSFPTICGVRTLSVDLATCALFSWRRIVARTCTLKGKPLTLTGPELRPGDTAPDATLKKTLVDNVRIADTAGKVRIFSVVPSLDTPVCAEQTKRFNEEAAALPNASFFTISCDLPTGMARFCGAEGIDPERLQVLSDHFDTSFGKAYGTLLADLRIETRAVFVVDSANTIRYAEYVAEVTNHPDYDAVLACVKEIAAS